MPFAVYSDRVIVEGKEKPATLIIDGEAIVEILPGRGGSSLAMKVEDYTGSIVMPGLVDTHVHINEPGRTEWEGFQTATQAAAAGGITTVVDMPLNSSPVTTSLESFEKKLAACEKQLNVDCGFFGGIVPGNEKEIPRLIERGILGFKSFLIDSGIEEFKNIEASDARIAASEMVKYSVPWLFHAEMGDVTDVSDLDANDYFTYLKSRPKKLENDAVDFILNLSNDFDCRMHIVHLSSAESLAAIEEARNRRLPVTIETCHHYLALCAEDISRGSTSFKCAPPIREKSNREELWKGIKNGIIDFVVSDHSPCEPVLKEGDFMHAWGGISGLQFSLPLFMTSASSRSMGIEDACRLLCEKPAKFVGLSKKGTIARNKDADLVIFDDKAAVTINENNTLHRHKLSPYTGMTLQGAVKKTMLRGEWVFSDREQLKGNRGCILLNH